MTNDLCDHEQKSLKYSSWDKAHQDIWAAWYTVGHFFLKLKKLQENKLKLFCQQLASHLLTAAHSYSYSLCVQSIAWLKAHVWQE